MVEGVAMRSRILVGGICTVLLLAVIGTCRQRTATNSSPLPSPTSANPGSEATTGSIEVPSALSEMGAPASASPSRPEELAGKTAILTADNPASIINVRSLPSATGEPVGAGQVGDEVLLGRTETAEDGYVWHYVTFQDSAIVGWIRSDLLDIQPAAASTETLTAPTPSHQSDALKQALDEQCGDAKKIESYFITQSHTIYVCKNRQQRLYLSQESGTQQVITAQDVEAVGGGYIIGNGNFEYRLDSGSFVVVRFDESGRQEEILREAVVYTERYTDANH